MLEYAAERKRNFKKYCEGTILFILKYAFIKLKSIIKCYQWVSLGDKIQVVFMYSFVAYLHFSNFLHEILS